MFGLSCPSDDIAEIGSDQRRRRNVASASRKLAALFFCYHGRMIQVTVVAQFGMCQVQIAA